MHRFEVTLRQEIVLPFRDKTESLDRLFSVNAKSKRSAAKAVRAAGYEGRIVAVRWLFPLPDRSAV